MATTDVKPEALAGEPTDADPFQEPLEPEAALERVLDAAHRPVAEAFWEALEAHAEETVRAGLREALALHAEEAEGAGLRGDPPEDPDACREALLRYRHAVAARVLPALELVLEHHRPTLLVWREGEAAFQAARGESTSLPFRVDVRWGPGALQSLPSDGVGRRLKKGLARLVSPARKPDGTRPTPVRAVALHHLGVRVTPVLADAVRDGVRAWAAWVARLERVCSDWAGEVLPVLTRMGEPGTLAADDVDRPQEDVGDEGAEDAPESGASDAWHRLRQADETFTQAVTDLLETWPHEAARERAQARLAPAIMELSSELRAVGSLVQRTPELPEKGFDLSRAEHVTRRFEAWDDQVASRLHMYRAFLEMLLGITAVLDRVEERTREAVLDGQDALSGGLGELEALLARSRSQTLSSDDGFATLRAEADEIVARAVDRFPQAARVEEDLQGIASDAVDALQSIVRGSPGTLVLHRLQEGDPGVLRPDELRSVPFQDRARQSLDAVRVERIRSAILEVGAGLAPVRASLTELPDVLAFAFDAARSELEGAATGKGPDDKEEGPPEERAMRFAVEALERCVGVVGDVPARVSEVLDRTRERMDEEMSRGGEALLERLGAGRMQSQLLRARSRFFELWLRLGDRMGPALRRLRRSVRFRYLRGKRATRRLHRAVRGLVGDAPVSDARAARTIRAFAQADSGPGHVPLVYQRLFSMEPVVDATFLVGRAAELADVLHRWRRWREEDEVPLVVRGYPGVGVTSFLNGCASMLEEQGATVVRLDVPERLLHEGEVAKLLADALGLEGAGPEEDLAGLARRVLSARRGGVPDVMVLDGLEHLYLRVPGGTDLLERLLTLMSESEPRVFWVAGVGQPAWQLVTRVEPTAVAQVDGFQLAPLTPERLRETILQRHRRSGLRLRFLEPREGRALLRRRARRLRGTEGHQRLLEQDFFEQLHRVSLGNLKLAMFHWLLAADFEAKEGEVLMHPLVRPDFTVLEGLDDTQNFALKALLEHRTLTLDEHCRIFRVGRQESYQIFESLQNRRVVEELAPQAVAESSELERTSRYRIRPLLVGAVTAHLRKRNIVH